MILPQLPQTATGDLEGAHGLWQDLRHAAMRAGISA